MTNSARTSFKTSLLLCATMLAIGCADTPASGPMSAEPQAASKTGMHEFPPDAYVIENDESLPIDQAIELLRRSADNKSPNPACLSSTIALYSPWAGTYVTVDLYDNNILKARAATPQEWEQLKLCRYYKSGPITSFWSVAAGKFVTAEFGYAGGAQGQLRARADDVAEWETFSFQRGAGLDYTIRAQAVGTTGAWYYVSGEFGYGGSSYGMLRARAATVDIWETWGLEYVF